MDSLLLLLLAFYSILCCFYLIGHPLITSMEIKLEVLTSTSIKQKKPWPRVSWLGQVGFFNLYNTSRNTNECFVSKIEERTVVFEK